MSSWTGARGLYAIVDPEHVGGRDPLEVARAILRGGCAVLQLRAKRLADRELVELARAMRALTAEQGVPFVVNDRADVARIVEADGLHLGQDDLRVSEARVLVGSMPIGLSTHDLAQAEAAVREGADLIGFGPVFPTATKENPDPVVGLDRLAQVSRRVPVPVVAIGGITADHLDSIRAAGAAFVAAISAVAGAPDPEAAARRFHAGFRP